MDDQKKVLIDRYLLGQLSVDEQKQFDLLLEESDFREALEFQQNLLKVVDYQEDTRLKDMFKEEEKKIVENTVNKPREKLSILKFAAIAASFLFLLWAGRQMIAPKKSNLVTEYFSPHTNSIYPKVKSLENLNEVEIAFYYYDEKKYKEALLKFETLAPEKKNDDVSFYYANVLLQQKKFEKAGIVLDEIINNNQTNFLIPAKWNLALVYISLNKYEEAEGILNEIKNESYYKKRVEELLKESEFNN